jgi:tRNA(Met) C34 N-acetyltransferase TmcA
MTSDKESFFIETDVEGYEGEERVFERRFRNAVPRNLV